MISSLEPPTCELYGSWQLHFRCSYDHCGTWKPVLQLTENGASVPVKNTTQPDEWKNERKLWLDIRNIGELFICTCTNIGSIHLNTPPPRLE